MDHFFVGMFTLLLSTIFACGIFLLYLIRRIYAHRFEYNFRRHILQIGQPRKCDEENMENGEYSFIYSKAKFGKIYSKVKTKKFYKIWARVDLGKKKNKHKN